MAAATTAQIEHERSISEAGGVDDGVSDTTCTPTRGGRPTRVGEAQIPRYAVKSGSFCYCMSPSMDG